MKIEQCYEEMGGQYEEVLHRMRSKERICKFMLKFLDDKSYQSLLTAMEAGEENDAFLAAHTLKGVSQTLGFTCLYEASSELTEALRRKERNMELFEAVKSAYEKTVSAINRYQDEKELEGQ